MKKITLLVFTLCISFMSYAQFPESFDGGPSIPVGWAVFNGSNGLGTVQSWQISDENDYAFVVWEAVTPGMTAEDWIVTPQVAITASNSILSFAMTDFNAPDFGSEVTVRISTDASQTNIAGFTSTLLTIDELDTNGGTFQPWTVDLTAYVGSSIYVAFVMENNDGDAWGLDDVDFVANAAAPDPVTTPAPADGAVDIFVDPADGADADTDPDYAVAFDWDPAATGDPATSYDVYLGDSPTTLNLLGNTSNDAVNITGMEYSTLYYWQIVAKNVGGDAVGSAIWSFTTQSDPLSVDDFEQNTFTHYYNSETEKLNLESSTSTLSNVEIYSILGQKSLVKKLSNTKETIDVSNLNSGIYLAKVSIDGNTKTIRFIKK